MSVGKASGYSPAADFAFEIAQGKPGYDRVNKFGRTFNVDAATPTDVWDGANDDTGDFDEALWGATAGITPQTYYIKSTNANDVDTTGTGMRQVFIQGLDDGYDLQSETVELDGTNNVETENEYTRIFRMYGTSWGSTGVNAGILTATGTEPGGIAMASIGAGNNQTLMACYTIPNGYTGYLCSYYASLLRANPSSASVELQLLTRPNADSANSGYQIKHVLGLYVNGASYWKHCFDTPLALAAKTDVVCRTASGSDNNMTVSAGFGIILVAN